MFGVPHLQVAKWIAWEQEVILDQLQTPDHLLRFSLIFDGLGWLVGLDMLSADVLLDIEFAYWAIFVATEHGFLIGAHSDLQTLRFNFL